MMAQVRAPLPVSSSGNERAPQRSSVDIFDQIRQREHVGDYETSLALRENTLAELVRSRDAMHSTASTPEVSAAEQQQQQGSLSGEIAFQAEELVKLYCCLSLDALNKNDFSMGFDLLQKAQRLVEHGKGILFGHGYEQLRVKARSAVLNNLGLFYYRTGDYKASVEYIGEAHRLEVEVLGTAFSENPGATMLNLAQAHIACGNNKTAIPVLQFSIQLLADQARHAAVTVQADDAVNLMIHCMSLLGHCLEATEDFNAAADTFTAAVERWKVRKMSATGAPSFENRLRELQEDMRRCQEKALRLPTIPLRATRPAKVTAARDKRGTKEHSHRLQLVSGHPEMQHERIVTTTLPATLPAPVWQQRPHTLPEQHAPTQRRDSAQHSSVVPSPYTQGLGAKGQVYHHRPTVGGNALPSPAAAAPLLTPENVAIPVGAVDVDLANNNRTTPQSSRKVFSNAPGLEHIYQQLDPQFKEAFDVLAAANPTRTKAAAQPHVFPESVLYGNRKNLDALLQQKNVGMKNIHHRHDYDRPWNSRSVTPSNAATPSRATLVPGATKTTATVLASSVTSIPRPASAPRAPTQPAADASSMAPRQPSSRPQSGRPVTRKANDTMHSSPLISVSSATFGGSGTRDLRDDISGPPELVDGYSSVTTRDMTSAACKKILSAFVQAKLSELVARERAVRTIDHLETRVALRREEALIARAESQRVLDQERARMARELAEAKLLMESRRRVSGPLNFTPSSRSLLQTASDPDQRLKEEETLHRTVKQMLSAHAECVLEKASSIHVTEELKEAIHVMHDETESLRHNAAITVQTFLRHKATQEVMEDKITSLRERALAVFTSAAHRRLAQRRVNNFLNFVVGANRAKLARFAAEESQQRRLVAAATITAMHMRTQFSARKAETIAFNRTTAAVTVLQAVGRGYFEKIRMSFRQREQSAREARELEHAGKVILHAMRRNLKLNRVEARWQHIEEENMLNKKHYAATCIQAQWRRHRYGYPLSLVWKENLAKRRLVERLRLEGEKHAAQVLLSCMMIQRAYRLHLGRRQLMHRMRLREQFRQKYLVSEMRAKAAQTLQAFSRIVRAKGSVRRIQEANNANLRTRRMIFEMEQQESEGGVVDNHPPPPLAPTPRQNASPLEFLAGFDHVDSRMSSNASKTHHPPRSNEISPTTAGAMAAASSGSIRHVAQSSISHNPDGFSPNKSFSPSKSTTSSTTMYGSPALFIRRTSSNTSFMGGASVSSALEQAIQATASLVRRLQFSEGTATLDSSLVVSSSSLPPRPLAISQRVQDSVPAPLQVEQITSPTSATRTVTASASHQTLEQRRAGVVLARFFRMLRRRRLAQRRREMQRQDTIKHESARFIQDCWRRYIGKRKLHERQLLKRGEQRSTIESESALIIQSAFRRHQQQKSH